MSELKFYSKKMREHCKSFLNENLEKLESKFNQEFSSYYPEKYESSKFKDTDIFNFISITLKNNLNSDYTVYRDNDLIDYRLNYHNSNNWNDIIIKKNYIESKYVWYYFSPTNIPIKIRELVVDRFDILEEFYIQSLKSHLKRFFIRGHVKEKWIKLDLLYKNGFNKYLTQFKNYNPNQLEKLKLDLLNYTETGIYGLLKNADIYSNFIYNDERKYKIQLLKFDFINSPTNEPVLLNSLIADLNLSPSQYLLNNGLLDVYLAEQNEPLNFLRTKIGLPRIGEGWISETKLFYQLKDEFSEQVVLQHFKPKWLGRQHFDIYFPFLNIAVEYQGKQHFESVEYFGGNEAFKQNIIRDKRKKDLAFQNNCELIYVEPGYNINDIISIIRNSMNFKKTFDFII